MATFGSIPSNDELNAGDNVGFAANLARTFIAASQAEEDALTNLRHGDELTRTDLGDNGIKKEWNGTAWVVVSGQRLQRVELVSGGSITLDGVVSGGSLLEVRYDVASDASANDDQLAIEFNGDSTSTNYHRQNHYATDGATAGQEAPDNHIAFATAANGPSNGRGHGKIEVIGYDESGTEKSAISSFIAQRGNNSVAVGSRGLVWDLGSTNAVTQILLRAVTGDLIAGSWAELWLY